MFSLLLQVLIPPVTQKECNAAGSVIVFTRYGLLCVEKKRWKQLCALVWSAGWLHSTSACCMLAALGASYNLQPILVASTALAGSMGMCVVEAGLPGCLSVAGRLAVVAAWRAAGWAVRWACLRRLWLAASQPSS